MATNIIGDTEWNGLPMPRRLGAIVAVAFGVSLSVIDSVIANVALPTLASEFGTSSANSVTENIPKYFLPQNQPLSTAYMQDVRSIGSIIINSFLHLASVNTKSSICGKVSKTETIKSVRRTPARRQVLTLPNCFFVSPTASLSAVIRDSVTGSPEQQMQANSIKTDIHI